ncbi:hypothetical protein [Scandinavium goeteborgense]|uniref:hypothetical protein n=1 Tax=Scandinavium goeteborgense TaxID=1851514 RepID=UPI000F65C908|nr:hypothetical protein [Scandinavium goeteborgense]QKN79858.1 hypothetical protein A8O29_000665 [Scandinavium goeteborgense]
MDIFTWNMAAWVPSEDGIFSVPADSGEFSIMNNNAYGYISAWVVKGYPVAAVLLMDIFIRVISEFCKKSFH